VSDGDRMQRPGEDMVADVLARAQRDRSAVSLVVVRGSTADAQELLAAIADAAPAGAREAVDDNRGAGRLMMLSGVLPKRACALAQAAVAASSPPPSGVDGIGVGIAGYPRHAHSAIELLDAAEAAAEKAAAAPDGDRVVIAADAP
jgi:hypothetical protein